MYQDIYEFWFEDIDQKSWWSAEPAFDQLIRQRFGDVLRRAALAELFNWRREPRGCLAEIIVLDQFSRNIYRGTPTAFAQDAMALALSQAAVARGVHLELTPVERGFLFLPYMHSESKVIHEAAEPLYRDHALPNNYNFELKHKQIIDRFGRYPYRNKILGRESTAEEVEFLTQPGSSF